MLPSSSPSTERTATPPGYLKLPTKSSSIFLAQPLVPGPTPFAVVTSSFITKWTASLVFCRGGMALLHWVVPSGSVSNAWKSPATARCLLSSIALRPLPGLTLLV